MATSDGLPLHLPSPREESWSFQGARLVAPSRSSSLTLYTGDATRVDGVALTPPSPKVRWPAPTSARSIYCVAHIATMMVSRDFRRSPYHWPLSLEISCRLQPLERGDKVLPLCAAREALQAHPLDNDAMPSRCAEQFKSILDRGCWPWSNRMLGAMDSGLRQISALRNDRDEIISSCLEFASWKKGILDSYESVTQNSECVEK